MKTGIVSAAGQEKYIPTAKGLVEYAKKSMCTAHVYLWDANGEYITNELLDRLSAMHEWYTPERIAARRMLVGHNVRGWDCIGLIKSYVWGDYHQGNTALYTPESDFCTRTLIEQKLVKGDIATLPERPGLVLWKKGHVGIYIGNGNVIECTIRNVKTNRADLLGGIVKTKLRDVEWVYWLEYPGILYE